jgi:uncharacterized linocin/CFP29 family protein
MAAMVHQPGTEAMSDVNDVTAYEMFKLRVIGRSWRRIAQQFGCDEATVHKAIDRMLPVIDTQMRVRMHGLELERLDELTEAVHPLAVKGDLAAIATEIKIGERRSSLAGLDAPQRLDMQLVEAAAKPPETTTDRIRAALDRIAAMRPTNGKADATGEESPSSPAA